MRMRKGDVSRRESEEKWVRMRKGVWKEGEEDCGRGEEKVEGW